MDRIDYEFYEKKEKGKFHRLAIRRLRPGHSVHLTDVLIFDDIIHPDTDIEGLKDYYIGVLLEINRCQL